MMINLGQSPILVTGTPGSGKTLSVISSMLDYRGSVFYHGIKGLSSSLSWVEIDAASFSYVDGVVLFGDVVVPSGSRVIIDECQRIYPAKKNRNVSSPLVVWLQTARHDGIELIFITQSPSLVDSSLRAVISTHHHLVRLFGQSKVLAYSMSGGIISPSSSSSLKLCDKKSVTHDKRVYRLYKSAEVHTVKRVIPHAFKVAFFATLFLLSVLYFKFFYKSSVSALPPAASVSPALSAPIASSDPPSEPVVTTIDYVHGFVPRVRGLPYTAPAYDSIAVPVSFPKVSGCLASRSKCSCYTQQATLIDMSEDMCRNFVQHHSFDMFMPDKKSNTFSPKK